MQILEISTYSNPYAKDHILGLLFSCFLDGCCVFCVAQIFIFDLLCNIGKFVQCIFIFCYNVAVKVRSRKFHSQLILLFVGICTAVRCDSPSQMVMSCLFSCQHKSNKISDLDFRTVATKILYKISA